LADKPFRLLRNPYPPVEVLSAEQLEQIHQTSLRILEEMGLEFLDEEALDIWKRAGAQVDRATGRVHMDREPGSRFTHGRQCHQSGSGGRLPLCF
jgi:trimethylamine--corrinoid protein Co-methyltransferase